MSHVHQSLQGSASSLEQAAYAISGHTGGIGSHSTTAMGHMSGQKSGAVGQAVAVAVAKAAPPGIATSAMPTPVAAVATAAPAPPPAHQFATLATA